MMQCKKKRAVVSYLRLIQGVISYRQLHTLHTRHIPNIHHAHHIFTILELFQLTWKLTGHVKPKSVIPLSVFFPGNLPVLGGGVEVKMSQVLLQ